MYEPKQTGRRRRYTVQQKLAILDEEAERPGETISSVARRYGMASSQLFSGAETATMERLPDLEPSKKSLLHRN